MLTLFEELFLLAVHEEKGEVIGAVTRKLHYGLNGAILSELAFQEKIRIGEDRRLAISDAVPTGDQVMDATLERIQSESNERKVTYWVRKLNDNPKKLRRILMERLVEKELLVEDDSSYSWLIPAPTSPEVQASGKYALKRRLREIALACIEPEIREVALLGLLRGGSLLNLAFIKDERKLARQRIYELLIGRALSNAVVSQVDEICVAVEAAVGAD